MKIFIVNPTMGGISGGYQEYLLNIIPRLGDHPSIEALACASPKKWNIDQWFQSRQNTTFINCAPFRLFRHFLDPQTDRFLSVFKPDILFIPIERYLASRSSVPVVVMFLNMGPLISVSKHNPLSEKLRYKFQEFEAKISAERAHHIIVPTQFVADVLTSKWRIPSHRITVIHFGSPVPYNSPDLGMRPSSIPSEWAGKFLFTAGSIEPYRGLEDIILALSEPLITTTYKGCVIAGPVRKNMRTYASTLDQLVKTHSLSKKILWTGILSKAEMAWCYRNCHSFITTSRVESFSVISVEAMMNGCICVVAHNPPFPEIFGDAARYYEPGNPADLARVLYEIAQLDSMSVDSIKRNVLCRSERFSWDISANRTVDLFSKVINSN